MCWLVPLLRCAGLSTAMVRLVLRCVQRRFFWFAIFKPSHHRDDAATSSKRPGILYIESQERDAHAQMTRSTLYIYRVHIHTGFLAMATPGQTAFFGCCASLCARAVCLCACAVCAFNADFLCVCVCAAPERCTSVFRSVLARPLCGDDDDDDNALSVRPAVDQMHATRAQRLCAELQFIVGRCVMFAANFVSVFFCVAAVGVLFTEPTRS